MKTNYFDSYYKLFSTNKDGVGREAETYMRYDNEAKIYPKLI